MRGRVRLAAVLVLAGLLAACASRRPAWELPPPPPREGPVVDAQKLHRERLANGLEILVLEDRSLPRVVLGLTLRRGEGNVPPERAGLVTYTAELMKRGAGDRDALVLAEAVDALGASLSVGAGWDSMTVQLVGLSRDLDPLFELFADVVRRPRFEPAEAVRARDETLAGLEQSKDDPSTLAGWAFASSLYPDHRYGLPIEGSPESVAGFDQEAARGWHQRAFVPANAILYATGDLSIEDARERAERAFGDWPPGPVPEPGAAPPPRVPTQRRVVLVDRPDLGQAQIRLGHEGISRADEDRLGDRLMNHVLGGGGFGSRLMGALREQSGLAYFAFSGFSLRRYPGPFLIGTATRVEEVGRAIALALAETEAVRDGALDASDLERARSYTLGRFALDLEESADVIAALVDLDVYGLPRDALDTFRARVRSVDLEALRRSAAERLHPDRMAIVVVGPAEAIRPQLETLGPVQIRQP